MDGPRSWDADITVRWKLSDGEPLTLRLRSGVLSHVMGTGRAAGAPDVDICLTEAEVRAVLLGVVAPADLAAPPRSRDHLGRRQADRAARPPQRSGPGLRHRHPLTWSAPQRRASARPYPARATGAGYGCVTRRRSGWASGAPTAYVPSGWCVVRGTGRERQGAWRETLNDGSLFIWPTARPQPKSAGSKPPGSTSSPVPPRWSPRWAGRRRP
ncbi:alkyl sulfatase C-terminal domain-containing protein [Streptomyces laculatispora]|uniref:Alkyl sulfatase C-terminal domain-containing protein n=1 Tax=Streptomyces laculatispora TaxID=887464 RepID=A0ABY9IG29_9ACTN|nr:alkyl sulfatase C-terminal domain-containing protein [Streptomyces laculatispora]WLQ45164.1 alkyl sulfatase C-terminal domain-containing protein [Streptomyces laculatispora]